MNQGLNLDPQLENLEVMVYHTAGTALCSYYMLLAVGTASFFLLFTQQAAK